MASTSSASEPEAPPAAKPQTQARLKITAGDTVLYAEMYDNETARAFMGLLPLTLDAFDRIGLVKSNMLPQSISDAGERTRQYEKGAVFYWPEGPEVAFCYSDHLPETVVDIIHIGKVESGIEVFEPYTGKLLLELDEQPAPSARPVSEQGSADTQGPVQVTITVGDTVVTAELDDSEIARQFAASLPQTISMSRVRDREYYGRLSSALTYDRADVKTVASDGDLCYWPNGDALALFFDTEGDVTVSSGIVVFGKITSDLSVFKNLPTSQTMTVTPAK